MKKLNYGATFLIAAAILYLTLTPQNFPTAPGGDKLHHFIAFAALCFPTAYLNPRALRWVIPAAIMLGGGIEIVQPYVNRSREMADFGADAIGVIIGVTAGLLASKVLPVKIS